MLCTASVNGAWAPEHRLRVPPEAATTLQLGLRWNTGCGCTYEFTDASYGGFAWIPAESAFWMAPWSATLTAAVSAGWMDASAGVLPYQAYKCVPSS